MMTLMLLGVKTLPVGSTNYLYQEGAVSKKVGSGKNTMLGKLYRHALRKKVEPKRLHPVAILENDATLVELFFPLIIVPGVELSCVP